MIQTILKWYAIGVVLAMAVVTVDFSIYLKRHKGMNFTSMDVVKIICYSLFFHWGGVFFYIGDFISTVLNRYIPRRKTKAKETMANKSKTMEDYFRGLPKPVVKTSLRDLCGDRYGEGRDEYQQHIREGRTYWHFLHEEECRWIGGDIKVGWVRILITSVRSGVAFYRYLDVDYGREHHFDLGSTMSMFLHPEQLSLSEFGLTDYKDKVEIDTLDGRITIVE